MDPKDETTIEDLPESKPDAADTDPDAGAADAKPDEGEAKEPARSTLDELVLNRPDWLAEAMRVVKPEDVDAEDLAAVASTIEGKRVLAAIFGRADAQTPVLEEKVKALTEREQMLAAKERLLAERQRAGLKWASHDKAKALLARLAPEGQVEEPEKFTEEWFAWKVDQRTRANLDAFFSTIEEIDREAEEQAAAAVAAEKEAAERQSVVDYVNENEDTFSDPRVFERVAVLVQNHNHDIKEAHRIALRELAVEDDAEAKQQAMELARKRIARGGRGGPRVPRAPEDPAEKHEFYTRNPDALRRDFEEAFPGWSSRMES